ncbi:MAG: type I-C CRISPR-associated endonuclease Cas1c [Bacillota bacterium]
MRKLLNTLYVTSPDSYLGLDGENVVVYRDEKEVVRLPLHNLEGIVAFGYTGASPALMGACAQRNLSLCFLTQHGRFLARVTGNIKGNVTLRKTQMLLSQDTEASAIIARNMITGKLFNARWVLERATRDYALRVNVERLKRASDFLQNAINLSRECGELDTLRGLEGEAASIYFGVLDELILQQKEAFRFSSRNRRPPLDPVNALLSFSYTLLANDMAAALETVGLDPYVGFLHRDRPGRASLALDMMEELRPVCADRFVLSLINRREINADGFCIQENGAVVMDGDTRKAVLGAWQARKQDVLTHPYLDEKIPWGLVPYAQALLLARFLRGDIDEYPPFLWK